MRRDVRGCQHAGERERVHIPHFPGAAVFVSEFSVGHDVDDWCDPRHRKKQARTLTISAPVSSGRSEASVGGNMMPNGSLHRVGVATRQRSSSRSLATVSHPAEWD